MKKGPLRRFSVIFLFMDFQTFLGLAAGTLTTASFIPQVVRTVRTKDTRSLSLGMYAVFVIGVALWIVYGIIVRKPPVIIANSLTLLLAFVVLLYKIRYK